ncbi:Zinc transporter YKE4 [Nakaseomyces glabratus]|uniref:Zinc transporter YKE4 n=1 Tax=Candida glabrata TaxID=5478 RepID=A0A0W0CPK4_CANGB|nr:ZIP Zinc transporter [Nakaseomyces glabratus]KAH7599423.1 ZIP Zinc transporter [Nakaseomyces glabratus]KAH7612836.1 ZIP Zinc transporter [Nakaseomyces glabratus]KTB01494.1 Zinc transporter YKE4 [Nakaseomyces glabratus]KTB04973.1 Zinc transporter YKE4 [Nakaseomyces glabratus]
MIAIGILVLSLCSQFCIGHSIEGKHDHGSGSGHSHSHTHPGDDNSYIQQFTFDVLEKYVFQYSPKVNALLASTIIQATPCLLVLLVPGLRNITNMNDESILITALEAFAFGTLMGDIFCHLIPESFQLFPAHEVGSSLFYGFLGFLVLDKLMKMLNEDDSELGHSHGHSHSHSHTQKSDNDESTNEKESKPHSAKNTNATKYIHVISGLLHHSVDGLVLASSFYVSTATGAITTVAILFHEVPHELGDFSIMLSSGFTYWGAFKAQMTIGMSAIVGTLFSCYLNETGQSTFNFETDRLLPITAGGFIFMATTGLLPRILAHNPTSNYSTFSIQLLCILVGFYTMSAMD